MARYGEAKEARSRTRGSNPWRSRKPALIIQAPFSDLKFSELYPEWIEHHSIEIEKSTAYRYKMAYTRMGEYLGNLKLNEITPDVLQGFVRHLMMTDLSSTSVNRYCVDLKLCLDYAVSKGYIRDNPMSGVAVPKRRRVEIHPFTPSEINLLLKQDAPDWVKDGIIIAYRTGMRLGEIYGLEWTDINYDEQFISVQRSQCRAGSKVFIKTTKTPCSVRRIDIDTALALHLLGMREKVSPDTNYVFPAPENPQKYLIPWNISTHLRQMCKSAGIPERNFHTLRHPYVKPTTKKYLFFLVPMIQLS